MKVLTHTILLILSYRYMALKYFIYKEGQAIIIGLSTDEKPDLPANGLVFIEEDTNKTYTVKNDIWIESVNTSYETTISADIKKNNNLIAKINETTRLIKTQRIMAQIVLNQKI